VDVIFRRGRFDAADVTATAIALVFFSLGLFAAAGVKILTQAFFALHDTRTPVIVATFDLAAFWALCLLLAGPMKHAGVALATSAGFWINFLALLVLLRRRMGRLGGRELARSAGRLALATAVMGTFVLFFAQRLLPYDPSWRFLPRAGWLVGTVASASAIFLFVASFLRAPEVSEVLGALRRQSGSVS
jgi:putative peptidoglycan lipid II flippase